MPKLKFKMEIRDKNNKLKGSEIGSWEWIGIQRQAILDKGLLCPGDWIYVSEAN